MDKVTVGADPEFFVVHTTEEKGEHHFSIEGLIGGTKESPLPIPGLSTGCMGQEDNVMAEFNVPPSSRYDHFGAYCTNTRTQLLQLIRNNAHDQNIQISTECEVLYPYEYLQTPQSRMFGCSPDQNAYKGGTVFPAISPEDLTEDDGQWRFAGGHIHIGYESKVPHFVAAMFADVYLGIPCAGVDWQDKRRQYYGQPGRYRAKPYGIEYRTLSNFWIHSQSHTHRLGRNALVLGDWLQYTDPAIIQEKFQSIPWMDVIRVIQNNNRKIANDLYSYIVEDLEMPSGGMLP